MNIDFRKANPNDYPGLEIFEIQPVVLGGSPTDRLNKIVLNRSEHIAAVVYWNRLIRKLRKEEELGLLGGSREKGRIRRAGNG